MDKNIFLKPIFTANPVTVLVLGICSALAVTAKLQPACVMALSVTIVTGCASFLVSLIRNTIPNRIRIIIQLVVVALFVILVDQILKAFLYQTSKQLSVYVGLIITNCIIMGRIEAFALGNKPLPSLIDGLANGMGYGIILIAIAFVRELFAFGQLFGYQVIPLGWYAENGGFYQNNGLFSMAPMALILVGIFIWVQRSIQKDLQEK